MRLDRLRITLAMVITGGYILILGVVIFAIIFNALAADDGINIIEEASKVLPGFIGMIVGYYFSRGSGDSPSSGDSSGQSTSDNASNADVQ